MSPHLYYNHTGGIPGLWSCLLPPSVAGQLLRVDPHKDVEPYKNKPHNTHGEFDNFNSLFSTIVIQK